jgi:hypothetical protein
MMTMGKIDIAAIEAARRVERFPCETKTSPRAGVI